jgi:hypothetical protein
MGCFIRSAQTASHCPFLLLFSCKYWKESLSSLSYIPPFFIAMLWNMNDQWFYFLNLELLCLEKNIISFFSSTVQLVIYGQGRIFETMRPMLAVFIAIIHSFKLMLTLMIYTTNINSWVYNLISLLWLNLVYILCIWRSLFLGLLLLSLLIWT